MQKLNFISNPRIVLFAKDTMFEDGVHLTPDQLPEVLIPGLHKAVHSETILELAIFAKADYDNYVRTIINTWDGVCVIKHLYKIYSDGTCEGCLADGKSIETIL